MTAPNNMTGTAQIATTAREIDFVTSFAKDVKQLQDLLGISRLIKKANGTTLKAKKATGTLESGDVGEGEEIPLSQFSVEETPIGTINMEKYRKGISGEAIADHGYDVAVAMTDEEMKAQMREDVLGKFYTFLQTGTLTSDETTWQMAIAMAIGRVKNKFQSIRKTATGIAVFVNTIDAYQYIGSASVTVQTAFGMDYIENFMGADVVFMCSDIPQDKVIATPLNNVIGYYVDPGDAEFAKAGLVYTVDAETGFVGFATKGNYERVMSEAFALLGITLTAEYLDAIAVITVDSSPVSV